MAGRIVVTSQYLLGKQEEWTALLGQAQEEFLAAATDTEKLPQHFWGNPVKKLQGEFLSTGKEGTAAFKRMKAHLGKLGEIAAVYEDAERGNVNVTTNH